MRLFVFKNFKFELGYCSISTMRVGKHKVCLRLTTLQLVKTASKATLPICHRLVAVACHIAIKMA